MNQKIEQIETALLACEKQAYARIRRERGEINPCEYARYFTTEERVCMGVLGWLLGLKSVYMIDPQNPAEYDAKLVYDEFCGMIQFIHDYQFFYMIGAENFVTVTHNS